MQIASSAQPGTWPRRTGIFLGLGHHGAHGLYDRGVGTVRMEACDVGPGTLTGEETRSTEDQAEPQLRRASPDPCETQGRKLWSLTAQTLVSSLESESSGSRQLLRLRQHEEISASSP